MRWCDEALHHIGHGDAAHDGYVGCQRGASARGHLERRRHTSPYGGVRVAGCHLAVCRVAQRDVLGLPPSSVSGF